MFEFKRRHGILQEHHKSLNNDINNNEGVYENFFYILNSAGKFLTITIIFSVNNNR